MSPAGTNAKEPQWKSVFFIKGDVIFVIFFPEMIFDGRGSFSNVF